MVVRHMELRFPDAPKFAVGCSLGGMLLFNYLSVECKGLTVGVDPSGSVASKSSTAALGEASGVESGVDEDVEDAPSKSDIESEVEKLKSFIDVNDLATASREKGEGHLTRLYKPLCR